ncbi:Protein real-time [Mycena indigotica]|uniref:Protein real-time n=1 Tax=Mycena indigotica TaxID=2126181 RepID=A0A8H6TFP3_9AGAR|nr:Protein real-time [Mycena indigotica]KAF7315892.1 Protein real-time [Mycena indigotica]
MRYHVPCYFLFSTINLGHARTTAGMDRLLQTNREKSELLDVQYTETLQDILKLQETLIDDILPSVADELELADDAVEWAREWLSDTSSVFRIMRRNKFTRSFAMESVRKTLVWRFSHLWPPERPPHMPLMQCLPPPATDPFGRPVLIIKVVSFNDSSDAYKPLLLRALERLRLHLIQLNEDSPKQTPVLQYVILLDLKDLSTQSLNIDLVTWTLREAVPHFPGMLAAAFMINYSWAHAGLWSIAKRVMPAPALARIFFPTQKEVTEYFTPAMLPQEYGGTLAPLTALPDPLRDIADSDSQPGKGPTPSQPPNGHSTSVPEVPLEEEENARALVPPRPVTVLQPTSLLNPFFGYPVSSTGALHHGRRRKRDLARTLLVLAWRRWKHHVLAFLSLVMAVLAIRRRRSLQAFAGRLKLGRA